MRLLGLAILFRFPWRETPSGWASATCNEDAAGCVVVSSWRCMVEFGKKRAASGVIPLGRRQTRLRHTYEKGVKRRHQSRPQGFYSYRECSYHAFHLPSGGFTAAASLDTPPALVTAQPETPETLAFFPAVCGVKVVACRDGIVSVDQVGSGIYVSLLQCLMVALSAADPWIPRNVGRGVIYHFSLSAQ